MKFIRLQYLSEILNNIVIKRSQNIKYIVIFSFSRFHIQSLFIIIAFIYTYFCSILNVHVILCLCSELLPNMK